MRVNGFGEPPEPGHYHGDVLKRVPPSAVLLPVPLRHRNNLGDLEETRATPRSFFVVVYQRLRDQPILEVLQFVRGDLYPVRDRRPSDFERGEEPLEQSSRWEADRAIIAL